MTSEVYELVRVVMGDDSKNYMIQPTLTYVKLIHIANLIYKEPLLRPWAFGVHLL